MTKLFDLHDVSLEELRSLYGTHDANLHSVEKVFNISLYEEDGWICTDDPVIAESAEKLFSLILKKIRDEEPLSVFDIYRLAEESKDHTTKMCHMGNAVS